MFPDSRSSASPGELTKWNFLHRWFPVRAKSEFGLASPQLCWSPECERQLDPGAPPRWQSCSFKVLLSVGKQGQSGSLSGSEEPVHPNARGHGTPLLLVPRPGPAPAWNLSSQMPPEAHAYSYTDWQCTKEPVSCKACGFICLAVAYLKIPPCLKTYCRDPLRYKAEE